MKIPPPYAIELVKKESETPPINVGHPSRSVIQEFKNGKAPGIDTITQKRLLNKFTNSSQVHGMIKRYQLIGRKGK